MDSCTVVTGAAGEKVAAVDLEPARLEECYGGNPCVHRIACDLTSAEGFKLLTAEIKARFAAVKGFVHTAGFDAMAPLGMIAPDMAQRLFALHAVFPMQFLGWMSRKPNYAPGASCVLISSLSAHEGAKGHVAYAAAKGGVEGFLKPAAAELVGKGIRLNAVVLGAVETSMSRSWMERLTEEQAASLRKGYPLGRGTPETVADAIMFLLSPAARWITGQSLVCDGGYSLG